MPGQHISNQERGTGARYYNFFMWFDHDDDVVESTALDHTAELIKEEVWVNPVKYYELDSDEEGEPDELQGDEEVIILFIPWIRFSAGPLYCITYTTTWHLLS